MRHTEYTTALELMLAVLPSLGRIIEIIRQHDRNLADQLKRASSSSALNLAEADGSDPGNRRARLHTALGSTSESRAALKVAAAWQYIDTDEARNIDAMLDRVAAMTWRRLRPQR